MNVDQVDAADIGHDPEHGADMGRVTEAVRLSRDRRIRLVIFNRRIFSSYAQDGVPAWTWRPYNGENPHDKHAHFEVNDIHHDETQPWQIGINMSWTDDVIPAPSWAVDKVVNPTWQARTALGYVLELVGQIQKTQVPELSARLAEVLVQMEAARTDMARIETKLDQLLSRGPMGTYAGTAAINVTFAPGTDGSA